MVNRCVAAGCSNTQKPGITLHKFPKDPVLRKQWERQVQRTRAHWKATESSLLCSEHFTPECFEDKAALASQFGIHNSNKIVIIIIVIIYNQYIVNRNHPSTPNHRCGYLKPVLELEGNVSLILATAQLGSTTLTFFPSQPQHQLVICRYAMNLYLLQENKSGY